MIRLSVKHGLMGDGPVARSALVWRAGLTPRAVLEQLRVSMPDCDLGIAVDGQRALGEDLDRELPRRCDLVVGAAPGGIEIGAILLYAAISTAVSIAIGYVASLLTPKPKPPGVPQERGDVTSAVSGWEGATTNYGPGQPIPFAFGRFRLSGQGIYTSVDASGALSGGLAREFLALVIALCYGPIYRLGGVVVAEQNGLGGFAGDPLPLLLIPGTIKIGGNLLDSSNVRPGARVWLRPGRNNQSPLPSTPFRGSTATFTVGQELAATEAVAIFTYAATDEIDSLLFTMSFPSGIYGQDGQGNLVPAPVTIEFTWRPVGTTGWRGLFQPQTANPLAPAQFGAQPVQGATAATVGADLQPFGAGGIPVTGPIEVRARRLAPAPPPPAGVQVVNQTTFRQLGVNQAQLLAYPGIALVGLQLEATGRINGSTPQFTAEVDCGVVKVWDQSLGWSGECWDVPAAPFNWMAHPPGQNNAWIAIAWLQADYGLGRYGLTIDLPAFRAWSIECDREPNPGNPWGEAQYCYDGAKDSPTDAWLVLTEICAAGRAVPLRIGNQVTVVYQYRDAHFDALVTVPAKAPVQLFSSGNVEDLQITWMPNAQRTTVLQYQFQNRAKDYAQDMVPVEDLDSTINVANALDPDDVIEEIQQAPGIVRESQLRRDGMYTHRVRRLVRREVTFKASPSAVALRPGDLFELEHDVLRPFDADVPVAMSVAIGGTGITTVVVDHPVSAPGIGVTLEFVARSPDQDPQRADVVTVAPHARGATLTLAGAVDAANGAACIVGKKDKLTQVYQTVNVGFAGDVKVTVRGVQWAPEAFDPLDPVAFGNQSMIGTQAPRQSSFQGPPVAGDLSVRAAAQGGHLISWTAPGQVGSRNARVWLQDVDTMTWALLAEVTGNQVLVQAFRPWRACRVAVALESRFGQFLPPEACTPFDFTAQEFPPAPPSATRVLTAATYEDNQWLFQWPDSWSRELAYYELRCGGDYGAARVLARTLMPQLLLQFPPATSPSGNVSFWLAQRWRSGLYGPPALLSVAAFVPLGISIKAESDELVTTPPGTLTRLTYGSPGPAKTLSITVGEYSGTYVSSELAPGSVANRFWQVRWDSTEADNVLAAAEEGTADDGDAYWGSSAARPPSSGRPGADLSLDPYDALDFGAVSDLPSRDTAGGYVGEVGAITDVLIESRFHDGSSYGAYAPHRDRFVNALKMQVRVTLRRLSVSFDRVLTQLDLRTYS